MYGVEGVQFREVSLLFTENIIIYRDSWFETVTFTEEREIDTRYCYKLVRESLS